MADKTTNCAQIRDQMADAASALLSAGILAAFNAHLRDCAACRDEFRRVQTLLRAIDHTMSASLAAEPSAQLVANVRKNIRQNIPQSIAAQPRRAAAWARWTAWATAAGVCAAFAILLFVARSSRKLNPPLHDSAPVHTSASSASKPASHTTFSASIDAAILSSHPRKPAFVRRASLRAPHAKAAEPKVIVQPGQMQAILRFAAAMQRGQIDGAQLLADQKRASEPIEIKPLPVASPLKIEPLDADSGPNPSAGSEGSQKDFVAGRSN